MKSHEMTLILLVRVFRGPLLPEIGVGVARTRNCRGRCFQ
jgi:hypothetical protein